MNRVELFSKYTKKNEIIGQRVIMAQCFKIWIVIASIFLFVGLCEAKDIYITQTAAGGNTGADCANAHAVTWFNSTSNWGTGTGKISPGDTVHLCGTITSSLSAQDGSAGNPVTILWETGAKLSQSAASTFIDITGSTYLIFDGGTNGIIENTGNGTGGTSVSTKGFDIAGAHDIEVRKLTFQNFYTHTSLSDTNVDAAAGGAFYINGGASNISIHDNTFTDIGWVINLQCGSNTCSGFNIYNNTITNYDHGIAVGMNNGGSITGSSFYNNHFGTTLNWDTTANAYHHDGIHLYINSGTATTGISIYNNLFDGDWGDHTTAQIYIENPWSLTVYNNVFIGENSRNLTNGHLSVNGLKSGSKILNNTIVGSGASFQTASCLTLGGSGMTVENNVVTDCANPIYVDIPSTFTSLDYNIYAKSGSSNAFKWGSTFYSYSNFAGWKSASGEGSHSSYQTSAGLSSTGVPQAGSIVLSGGANLTSLDINTLNSDKAGTSRPINGAWGIGAFQLSYPLLQPKNLHVN